MSDKRVVITGLGVFSPIGNSTSEAWENAVAGKSGVVRLSRIDPEQFTSQVVGEVKDFNPAEILDPKSARRNDRYTQLAMAAARQAWDDSGLSGETIDPQRVGVIIGSGVGGMETFETQHSTAMDRGPRRISSMFVPMMISNMAAGQVAIDINAKGPNFATVTACASSSHAIACSVDAIRLGRAEVMVTGGSEAPLTMMSIGGFCSMKALCTTFNDEPAKASRPFDKDRSGFVIAEGACIIVLEELEHAKARGVNIVAEVAGIGMSCDAHHITAPSPGGEGCARAMVMAIKDAGMKPGDVDYVNAHGTSTLLNDINETAAIRAALGDQADNVMVSSTKAMHGHMLGATGGMEIMLTALALKNGIVPPTATHENPGEGCDLDYVPGVARKVDIQCALSNSLGFGGHNVCIALRKYKGDS
ncbi:MAG: beta-ketoacyl-ACP synthase II [Candidatus Sabulitectum sp.]|nr:beta-ketoacyl-ACP synthase II [Candidatus Sabulitectum sp.]